MELSHRQRWIIERAKHVFMEKGYFQTIMEDIALASDITRRTLYRHFETKEEIAYLVTQRVLEETNNFAIRELTNISGNGIERLEKFLDGLVDYMLDRPDVMKYLGEFDFYFTDEGALTDSFQYLKAYRQTVSTLDELIMKILEQGVLDGSIREDIDLQLYETTMAQVLWGFGQRIAIRGKGIEEETKTRAEHLIRCQVTIYIESLKKIEEGGTQ